MKYGLPLCLALAMPLAHGQAVHDLSVDELKHAYLSCSEAALAGRLPTGAIQVCSEVYEQLKQRAFGGDFLALLAWSSAQPVATRDRN